MRFELKDNCYVSDSMILFLEYRAIPGPKIGTWGTQLWYNFKPSWFSTWGSR
jgi:hypothetical protein